MRGLKAATPALLRGSDRQGRGPWRRSVAAARGERVRASIGEWDYVNGFRTRELQTPPDDEAVYRSLRRRLIVANEGDLWRMRVPLMRRWLIERG